METLQRTANRGSISTGYDIDNSLKCSGFASNEWFYRSSPTASSTQTTFTFSFWIKRTQVTGYAADPYLMSQGSNARFHFTGNSPTLRFMWDGSTTELEAISQLKDTSAWYHIVLAVDTTQSTASDRVKAYVNGVQYAWSNSKYPTQSSTSTWMSTTDMYFNTRDGDGSYDGAAYWAEVCVIDGQQLDPTDFGEFDADTGIWKPIDVSGLTFGSEGFYLKFDNSGSLGADSSGNSNDCTLNNITSADQATDTPTNNFAILNPKLRYPSSQVIEEGNTEVTRTSGTGLNKTFIANIPVYNGKWYAEFEPAAATNYVVGIMPDDTVANSPTVFEANYIGNSAFAESISYYSNTGQKIVAPSGGSTYGDTWASGDTIGIALDMDNNFVYFSKNGTWQNSGDPTSGSSGTGGIALTNTTDGHIIGFSYDSGGNMYCNFGGYTVSSLTSAASDANGYGNFEYAPPSGYYAICTKNLAEFG